MRKVLGAFAVAALLSAPAMAGVWETQCAGCHNGAMAPNKDQLKAKFKTAKAFVKAAQNSTNPMMAAFKSNVKALQDAAKEIYGK